MITVFSGTNRKDSRTRIVAEHAYKLFQTFSPEPVKFFSLEDLPEDILHVDMYKEDTQSKALAAIQDDLFVPANKFYFVVPEYNGGFPGVLKLFLDAMSIRKYKESFQGGKKAALLGVAAGRAGNLRGLEHLTGILNYLQVNVMPNRQPISTIEKILDTNSNIQDEATLGLLEKHVRSFIEF